MHDLQEKSRQEAELHKQREGLVRQHHEGMERNDLYGAYE